MATTVSLILLGLSAVAVLTLAWNLARTMRLLRGPKSVSTGTRAAAEGRSLEVFVPVKDEQDHIQTCIESILQQTCEVSRIVVVNDRSTDDTPAIVQRIQDGDRRVRRVDIRELSPGCYGKPHALEQARREMPIEGEFVPFVDSDSRLEPACLGTLVDAMIERDLDWIAAAGRPELNRFWERVLIPILGAVTFAWYDPRKISDPDWPDAVGSGLMVCRRSSYEAVGGHGAVIDVYDEDSELMRIAKRTGQRIEYVLMPDLFAQRFYGTLGRTMRGLTRTLAGGVKTIPRLALTINALNLVSLMPLGLLGLLGLASVAGLRIPGAGLWLAAVLWHLVTSLALAGRVYRAARVSLAHALCHPLGAAVTIVACLRAAAMVRSGRALSWRGTTYTSDDAGSVLRRGVKSE